jgi:hypothetical protein
MSLSPGMGLRELRAKARAMISTSTPGLSPVLRRSAAMHRLHTGIDDHQEPPDLYYVSQLHNSGFNPVRLVNKCKNPLTWCYISHLHNSGFNLASLVNKCKKLLIWCYISQLHNYGFNPVRLVNKCKKTLMWRYMSNQG